MLFLFSPLIHVLFSRRDFKFAYEACAAAGRQLKNELKIIKIIKLTAIGWSSEGITHSNVHWNIADAKILSAVDVQMMVISRMMVTHAHSTLAAPTENPFSIISASIIIISFVPCHYIAHCRRPPSHFVIFSIDHFLRNAYDTSRKCRRRRNTECKKDFIITMIMMPTFLVNCTAI